MRRGFKAEIASTHDDTRLTYEEFDTTISPEPDDPRLQVHAFAPDGSRIYLGDQAIDLLSKTKVDQFELNYHAAMLAPDDKTLLAFKGSTLVALDPQTGEHRYSLRTNEPPNYASYEAPEEFASMTISEDGSIVAAGTDRGKVHIWELSQAAGAQELKATRAFSVGPANGLIRDVALSPDGKYLATANGDGTAYLLALPE